MVTKRDEWLPQVRLLGWKVRNLRGSLEIQVRLEVRLSPEKKPAVPPDVMADAERRIEIAHADGRRLFLLVRAGCSQPWLLVIQNGSVVEGQAIRPSEAWLLEVLARHRGGDHRLKAAAVAFEAGGRFKATTMRKAKQFLGPRLEALGFPGLIQGGREGYRLAEDGP